MLTTNLAKKYRINLRPDIQEMESFYKEIIKFISCHLESVRQNI
jgi:hypothetical protein